MSSHDTPADHPGHDDLEALLRSALQADAERYTPDADLEDRIARQAVAGPVVALPVRNPRATRLLVAAAAIVVVVLIAGSLTRKFPATVDMDPLTGSTVPGSTTSTSTTAAPSTVATAVATTTEVTTPSTTSVTTAPATVMPTTVPVAPTTTTTPTTTAPVVPGRLLRPDGIGDVAFGGSTAAAERTVTAVIGAPVTRFTDPACSGEQIVTWGSFAIWDRGGQLTRWQLIGDATLGLTTTAGIGVGSTKADVVEAYPGVDTGSLHQPDPRVEDIGMNAPDGTWVWAAAVAADGKVAGMSAVGAVLPEVCLGHDLRVMELAPHARGLGILALGTPTDRALAVLRAAYIQGVTVAADDGASCGGDKTWFSDDDPVVRGSHVVTVLTDPRGVFRRWGTLANNTVPNGPVDGDGRFEAGMTLGEIRAAAGDRLTRDTSRGLTSFFYRIAVEEPAGTAPLYRIELNTSGDADSDRVQEIWVSLVNPC